ncbi:uncharacterized protein LOC118186009 [Stegodyphus dumicola]|uniref:uncharacterized protein LOC118186009 n=1 Tax=Stegodyphus dumicola TaxID=202533 RepID=UPI0015AC71F0|nr:uncharacterized protein LOC118186009 [Stegodyphus dumicola]
MVRFRLEDICLLYIRENFKIFNHAYLVSENETLQANLGFLQLVYSNCLLEDLRAERKLSEKYLRFLFNEHLTELNFVNFSNRCLKTFRDYIPVPKNLVKVTFDCETLYQYPDLTSKFEDLLRNVKILCVLGDFDEYKGIPVHFYRCVSSVASTISRCCVNLEELDLSQAKVSFKLLKILSRSSSVVRSLRVLQLVRIPDDRNKIPYIKTLAHILRKMPFLQVVSRFYVPEALHILHGKDLIKNRLNTVQTYSLTKLEIYTGPYEEILTICTVLCPNVTKLTITVRAQEHLHWCSKFPKLEALKIICGPRTLNLNNLLETKGSDFTSLKLGLCLSISLSVLARNCQKLRKLHLGYTTMYYPDTDSILTLKSLKELRYCVDKNCPHNIKALSLILNSSSNLENLYLLYVCSDPVVNNMVLKCCERNTLKHLYLHSSSYDADFLKIILKSCTSLQRLSVGKLGRSDSELKDLTLAAYSAINSPEIEWILCN